MNRNIVETLIGALVLFVAAVFVFISYQSGNIAKPSDSYKLFAKFKEVGTLSIGSDVRVAGVKVGSVASNSLDDKTYMAIIELLIDNSIKLPKDSSASIVSDGLLGGKYVSIDPGGEDRIFKNGDEIKYTQDAINFESLIGKFAFGGGVDIDDSADSDLGSSLMP